MRILLFCLSLVPLLLRAQGLSFKATVSENVVEVGQVFEVSFVAENAEMSDFRAPNLSNFTQVAGPNQSESFQYFNGKMRKTMGISYVLMGRQPGKFTIGPAQAKLAGSVVLTQSLNVEVLPMSGRGNAAQGSGTPVKGRFRGQIRMNTIPSKSTAYLGEQVTVEYRIVTSANVQDARALSFPKTTDVLVSKITEFDPNVQQGGGSVSQTVYKMALFPIKTGAITVDPLVIQVGVPYRDPNFGFMNLEPVEVAAQPITLNIKPLPDGPANFSGAVGQYTLKASVDKNQVPVGEAISLVLEIDGMGDIKQIQAPDLGLSPDSFEVYDPTFTDDVMERAGRLGGTKRFEYVIIPKVMGNFSIKPRLVSFDPNTATFQTIGNGSIAFNVTKGVYKPNQKPTEAGAKETPITKIANHWVWGVVLLLFAALAGFGFWLYKRMERKAPEVIDEAEQRMQTAKSQSVTYLEEARTALRNGDKALFYKSLSEALWKVAAQKTGLQLAQLNKDNVSAQLQQNGFSADEATSFVRCLGECEMAIYAPFAPSANTPEALLSKCESFFN